MPVESGVTGIQDLNPAWPTGSDPKSEGDDHLRLTKQAIQDSFPGMSAAWTTTQIVKHADGVDLGDSATVRQIPITAYGWVESDGNRIGGSNDWTCVRTGVGSYEITFDEVASNPNSQAIIANAVGLPGFANGAVANVAVVSGSVCVIQIVLPTVGYVDQKFTFIRQRRD